MFNTQRHAWLKINIYYDSFARILGNKYRCAQKLFFLFEHPRRLICIRYRRFFNKNSSEWNILWTIDYIRQRIYLVFARELHEKNKDYESTYYEWKVDDKG